jgi:carbamoyl-phosphate synthase small subunit
VFFLLPALLPDHPPALLALADGTHFTGRSIGADGHTVGEVVFNTALTGYQEILTDPSYCRQIVTLTYPHIGNSGVNDEDVESTKVHAAGLIVRDLPLRHSNFRATRTLQQYLRDEGTVAIADIDTRRLTRQLRTHGAQNGCITAYERGTDSEWTWAGSTLQLWQQLDARSDAPRGFYLARNADTPATSPASPKRHSRH